MVISLQVEQHKGFLQEQEMASRVEALTLSTLWGKLPWACSQARSSGRNLKSFQLKFLLRVMRRENEGWVKVRRLNTDECYTNM